MFISKALRRAEVFLEQVDESVAQASRRLVVEGVTGAVEESEDVLSSDEEHQPKRASAIPRAEERASVASGEQFDATGFNDDPLPDDDDADGWGFDMDIGDDEGEQIGNEDLKLNQEEQERLENDGKDEFKKDEQASDHDAAMSENLPTTSTQTNNDRNLQMPVILDPAEAMASAAVTEVPPKPLSKFSGPVMSKSMPEPYLTNTGGAEQSEYINALKEESSALRKELENMERDFEKSRRERNKLVKNLKRMKEIVSELDESLREKSAEARDLEEDLNAAKDEITSLRTKSRESSARGKDEMDLLRKDLNEQIEKLSEELEAVSQEADELKEENERLNEALLQGHEVELATADGARQEASQAHKAYDVEAQAHRETRKKAKEREEALEAEAALAASALAAAQRKAEECTIATSNAKSSQRAAETKLATVTAARDAAFARVEDLQEALRLYETGEGKEAPGQIEAKELRETVQQMETALEAKNVELNRLEGEVESLRLSLKSRRDVTSPRTPGSVNRSDSASHQEVEAKLRHMADSALRKQAQLEVLRSENRALQHQLTTERKRTREAQAMAAAASSSRQTIRGGFKGILDVGEEDRGERAYGVRDGPLARFRTPRTWPRAVSKVVMEMDRFSAQALAFLRREPLLRIVILIYLVAMHIFVYSLLHWHVDTVSGSVEQPHERVASQSSGGQIKKAT